MSTIKITQFKDAKFPLVCSFGLHGAKNDAVTIEKSFILRRGSYPEMTAMVNMLENVLT